MLAVSCMLVGWLVCYETKFTLIKNWLNSFKNAFDMRQKDIVLHKDGVSITNVLLIAVRHASTPTTICICLSLFAEKQSPIKMSRICFKFKTPQTPTTNTPQ